MAVRPPLPVGTIKDEIRAMVKGGRVSHYNVHNTIRKKYPDYELGGGYFRTAIEQLVNSGEVREVNSRLEAVKK